MSRRKGRILAFQGLYSLEVGKNPLEEVLKFNWNIPLESEKKNDSILKKDESDANVFEIEEDDSENNSESCVFARMLISGTVEHLAEIDEVISKHLTSWDISRINRVSLSILRMSVYSLMYQSDIQPSIVIDEAIHISRSYGSEDSFKFVNAILDNIRKYLQNIL